MNEESKQNINFKDLISKDIQNQKKENKNNNDDTEHEPHKPTKTEDQTVIDDLNKENSKLKNKLVFLFALVLFICILSISCGIFLISGNYKFLLLIDKLNLQAKEHENITLINQSTIELQQKLIDDLKNKLNEKTFDSTVPLPLPPYLHLLVDNLKHFSPSPVQLPTVPYTAIDNFVPPGELPVYIDKLSKEEKAELRKLDFKLAMIEKERMIKISLINSEKNVIQKDLELLEVKRLHNIEMTRLKEMQHIKESPLLPN